MIRAISIVMIVAIALQTVGCSSWRPLARASGVSEDERQLTMRDQVLGKLSEGMRVRITFREGAAAPIKGEVVECVIEKIGVTSLTATPVTFYVRITERRQFTVPYTDIVSIEFSEARKITVFLGGVAVGTILGWFLRVLEFRLGSD